MSTEIQTENIEESCVPRSEDNFNQNNHIDLMLSDVDDDDGLSEGDTWIEELECALLADCDTTTLRKISEGKRIPTPLRPDFWRALLALNEAGPVKLCTEFDLDNQLEVRHDCERLIYDLSQSAKSTSDANQINEADALRLVSSFESTITTYVKARPELSYVHENGWIDILKVLYHLDLNDSQLYQMFFRIVDRYIPKDLTRPMGAPSETIITNDQDRTDKTGEEDDESVQAYHLLRLLIQYHDPTLCSMLDSKKVTPNLYVKDWFCCLFARSCSPQLSLLIWDTHFKMADPFLIFFAAIVMVVNASDELKQSNMNNKTMLDILKTMPGRLQEDDVEDLYYLVSNHYTNTTPRSIRSYSHLFFLDTFGSTYSGNESPECGSPLQLDLITSQLISQLDLSQYLCLPIVPAEIFALDTAQSRSPSPNSTNQSHQQLKYFLVDCRPAKQYNAGHLKKAFHLDCSLMLREPASFTTAVNVLLDIQKQVVESKSNTGGQHLCFIGSGHEEDDQYVNMVVASFLQKYKSKYVSIVVGGFGAIHDYVSAKTEFKDRFDEFIVDHTAELCKVCYTKSPDAYAKYKAQQQTSLATSAQQLFTSTASFLRGDKTALSKFAANHPQTSQLAQSGATMLDKFAKTFVSKSNVIKDRLVETLQTSAIAMPSGSSGNSSPKWTHVSSQDRLGRRYTGTGSGQSQPDSRVLSDNSNDIRITSDLLVEDEPIQEVQLDIWQQEVKIIAMQKCSQIKGQLRYPGYIGLSETHLWILREIPHNKGFASIAAQRPLDTIVQITSKKRQPEMIIFRYGKSTSTKNDSPEGDTTARVAEIVASDHVHIPQPYDLIRFIKREIVRIMDMRNKESEDS